MQLTDKLRSGAKYQHPALLLANLHSIKCTSKEVNYVETINPLPPYIPPLGSTKLQACFV